MWLLQRKNLFLREHLCIQTKWGYAISRQRDELESVTDKVQEHSKKVCVATEKPSVTVMTDAGKAQMDLFEKEWPNVRPLVECPKPECGKVGSFTKAGTERSGQIIKCSKASNEAARAICSRTRSPDYSILCGKPRIGISIFLGEASAQRGFRHERNNWGAAL